MSDFEFGSGVEPWQHMMLEQMKPKQYFGRVTRSPWYTDEKKSDEDEV